MASAEAIAKAVAAVAAAFAAPDTQLPVLISASNSIHRLLTEGEALGLDVTALVGAVADGGLMRQMTGILQDRSRLTGTPGEITELSAVLVLSLSAVFARSPAAASAAGDDAVAMVAGQLEDAQAMDASAKAAAAAAAIIDGTASLAGTDPHTVPSAVAEVVDGDGNLAAELRTKLEDMIAEHQVVLFMKGVPDAPVSSH